MSTTEVRRSEVDQTAPDANLSISKDGLEATLVLDQIKPGHVHEFDLFPRDLDGGELLHRHAYYTVNEIPKH